MAIIKNPGASNDEKLDIEINNGDYQALKTIKEKFNLADEPAVLRYALAVLSQAQTDTLYIDDGTGAKVGLQPSDSLRRPASDAPATPNQ